MTRSISIIFVFITQFSFGQVNNDLILTAAENEIWISEITQAPVERQLTLLKNRILADTNVYVRTTAPDRIKIGDESESGRRQESFGRPLLVLSGQCNNRYLRISNRTDNKSIERLASFLTIRNVKEMTILTNDKATAIYGSRATAGVFILTFRKKLTCKSISKIDFGGW